MERPAGRKGKERLRIPAVLANATVLKVKSIALQVFCGFVCVCVCLHSWLISEFKTFNIEDRRFVLIVKKSTDFASQGCIGLSVVYTLLYGFIYFNCANHLEDFFSPKCHFGFVQLFFCFVLFFLPWNNSAVGILSIWKPEIFQPLEHKASLSTGQLGNSIGRMVFICRQRRLIF